MYHECVVAVYDSWQPAREAVRALEADAYPEEQISLVTHSVTAEVPREDALQYGDETENTAAKGAGIGGLVGALLGAPLLTIPGIGPLLIAGPLATSITGAIVGGFLGAMGGWGIHEDHVRQYEELVRDGKILVVAHGDPEEIATAKRILDETPAEEVHVHTETSADDVSP